MEISKSKKAEKKTSAARAAKAAKPIGREEAARRIDKYITQFGDWRSAMMAELREIIHEVNPDIVEDWKWMGTPVWSHEGMLVHGNIFKQKVKLTFHHGAQLPDPKKLFNASLTAKQSRAIDYFKGDKLDVPALKTLLRAAMEYNATHTVAQSKGSRDI